MVALKGVQPSKLAHFTGFTGGTGDAEACNGETECSFTVTEEDSSIEALFENNARASLSLQKEGGGTAAITSAPVGIKCLNTCSTATAEFYSEPSPEEVTIDWNLSNGTSSIEWTSGAGTCTGSSEADEGSCEVTMDEAHELVATLE